MPIQQHALPQDVTGYKFRLVGDMTLKQFLMLAVSIVLCIAFYGSPLPFFFRIPLAALFLMLGIGLAFVPVQGRPLDQWLVAFIKSIYSPTQYRWQDSKEIDKSTTPIQPTPTNISIPTTQPTILPTQSNSTNISPNPNQPSITLPKPPSPSTTNTPMSSIQTSSPTAPQPTTPLPPSPSPTSAQPITQPVVTPPQPATTPPTPSTPHQQSINSLPIPFTPTTTNTIVGLTLTAENKILDGVLIEIKTNGLTIRATKSNKLGQFMFARALENGLYQISAEKQDYTFDTYSLELKGQIINPLKIQAKP